MESLAGQTQQETRQKQKDPPQLIADGKQLGGSPEKIMGQDRCQERGDESRTKAPAISAQGDGNEKDDEQGGREARV